MVKIRLRRVGPKKQPSYRIVVTDSHAPRDGRFIETIGHYNPRTEPMTVEIKEERARYWLGVGAQPTEAVARLLHKQGIIEEFQYTHKEVKKAEAASEEAAAEAQPAPEAPEEPGTEAPEEQPEAKAPEAAEETLAEEEAPEEEPASEAEAEASAEEEAPEVAEEAPAEEETQAE